MTTLRKILTSGDQSKKRGLATSAYGERVAYDLTMLATVAASLQRGHDVTDVTKVAGARPLTAKRKAPLALLAGTMVTSLLLNGSNSKGATRHTQPCIRSSNLV